MADNADVINTPLGCDTRLESQRIEHLRWGVIGVNSSEAVEKAAFFGAPCLRVLYRRLRLMMEEDRFGSLAGR
jgi:hypothetical protein